jgi:hypothetical protein
VQQNADTSLSCHQNNTNSKTDGSNLSAPDIGDFSADQQQPTAWQSTSELRTQRFILNAGKGSCGYLNLSDFYRELGDLFGTSIHTSNRWGGFKELRARRLDHLASCSRRSVILADEAQEMSPLVLNELRLLASACFDSQSLLYVVLSGDARLLDKLRREELIPLGSRIRTRLATEAATRDDLLACLDHLPTSAGNATLMIKELRHSLVDHAAGNYRIFIAVAGELLMSAAQREITTLDEKLYCRSSLALIPRLPDAVPPEADRTPQPCAIQQIRSTSPTCLTKPWSPSTSSALLKPLLRADTSLLPRPSRHRLQPPAEDSAIARTAVLIPRLRRLCLAST